MLGMIFGVAAVVAMLSIGAGAQQEVMVVHRQLGVRNLIVEAREAPDIPGAGRRCASSRPGCRSRILRIIQSKPRRPSPAASARQAIHAVEADAEAVHQRDAVVYGILAGLTRRIGNLQVATETLLRRCGDDGGGAGGGAGRSAAAEPVRRDRSGRPLRQGQRPVVPGDRRGRPAADGAVGTSLGNPAQDRNNIIYVPL
jgi:putative ABC transport system permease protein